MNRQVYAFLVPLVLLLVLGYTPLTDLLLKGFKDEVNMEGKKVYTYLTHKWSTVKILREGFKKDVTDYEDVLRKEVGGNDVIVNHLLNYIYYINERSIAMVENYTLRSDPKDKDAEETKLMQAVLQYDNLARTEYQCVLEKYGEVKMNVIDLYKSKGDVNEKMARLTYGLIQKFPKEKKEKAMEKIEASQCHTTRVYEER